MSEIYIPEGYRTPLSVYEMQRAIEFIKHNFQVNLGSALNLRHTPQIMWALDDSITYGAKMLKLINSLEVKHDDGTEQD